MMTNRSQACARCGGTGYVYLWSIAPTGVRGWFCNRSTCKRFWSDASATLPYQVNGVVVQRASPVLVATAGERALQPA